MADITLVPFATLAAKAEVSFSDYPRFMDLLHRLQERPAWKKVQAVLG